MNYLAIPPHYVCMVILTLLVGCKDASLDPGATGSLEGIVQDEATGDPLSNVELTTSPPSDVITSDSEGAFSFSDLEIGDYNIRARKLGYETRSVSVSVRESRTAQMQLFMNEEDESDERALTAEVEGFTNRTDDEGNTSVRVQYRIRNTGSGTIPEYEVTFRVEVDQGTDRIHQIEGELLREEQSDVGDFELDLDGAEATDAVVDEVWFED